MIMRRILKWGASAVLLVLLLVFLAVFVAYWRSTNDCSAETKQGELMKAIVYCDYGSPDVLKLEEIERPVPNDDQVLIKVRAASVNPYDWHFMRGIPYIMRTQIGLRKPKSRRFGVDVAGEIAAVGRNVRQFKVGDEVFGACDGALAEYCIAKARMTRKPTNISFEQAAALPIAGITALQGVRDQGHVQPGEKVLINGASGGVGTFAVQIAKSFGADVTGVCSGRNAEMVRSLGADRVIDYTKEDFTKGAQRYDVILDCVGTQPLLGFKRVLKPKGIAVLIGGGGPDDGNWIGPMARPIKAMILSPFVSQEMSMFMADMNPKDLAALADLIQAGKVTPVIDRTYPLSETADAIRYIEKGHARGKVIVALK
ncbi:NAD(P)-dependent alcohol dehydrogenase [soil metagenome]